MNEQDGNRFNTPKILIWAEHVVKDLITIIHSIKQKCCKQQLFAA